MHIGNYERRWGQIITGIVIIAIVLLFLYRVRSILPMFITGFVLAYLLDPLVDQLEERGWSRGWAALLVFAFFLLLFAAVIIAVAPLILSQVQAFVEECMPPQGRYYLMALKVLERWEGRNEPQDVFLAYATESLRGFSKQLGNFILKRIQWMITSVVGIFSLLLLPIITYYFLQIIDPLRERLLMLLPPQYRAELIEIAREIGQLVGRYFRGYLLMCICVGIISTVVLYIHGWIFGMDYALAVGFFAGATYSIPYLGALGTALLGGLVGYLTSERHAWVCAVSAIITLSVINQIFDWLVTPRVVGRRVGLSALVVLFSVMAGSVMLGIVGMVIAVPVAGSIKILLMHFMPQLFEPVDVARTANVYNYNHHAHRSSTDGNAELTPPGASSG